MNKVFIVIPSLNPDENLKLYIEHLLAQPVVGGCIVVDDGSTDNYQNRFDELEKINGCTVIHHNINQGKGASLKTAFSWYLENNLSEKTAGIVTADADGQHRIEDVAHVANRLCTYISEKQNSSQNNSSDICVLILGTRHFSSKEIPWRSRFGNKLTEKLFYLLYHIQIEDTQTGLRGISAELLPLLLSLKGNRYEYEMKMLSECAIRKIPILQVPIETVYEENNSSSHFNPILDSIRIYRVLLETFLKFVFSSLASSLVDLTAFQILILVFRQMIPGSYIILSTVIARIISGIFNFTMNRRMVFQSRERLINTAIKYFLLWLTQMLVSAYGVQGLHTLTHLPELLVKIIVDTALFFISYRIQKNRIFKS